MLQASYRKPYEVNSADLGFMIFSLICNFAAVGFSIFELTAWGFVSSA